ncbi:hypothetical protein VCUG_00636 [Vavraia culicis subsp. floridensis]|uniref:Uncharacterized protein n=1 Tax=Vavraia culicis (isolate floridensis) TaxID=948595 RepID=L2GW79_VAVCU|nr:uncharacterized protein VCUG_00636 [Vavraia culicis subsp. floridensis]ELA47916.1 hypothetical protein VCUG_00636 [Vavraia culicis subsp. floridensis]
MNEFPYHFCKFKTIKGKNSVDPMIFFSNLLFIHQLLCTNTDDGEGDDGSEYVYTEKELRDDLKHLLDEPEEHLDLRYAHIVECLLLSDCKTLLKRATMKKYKNLQTFYHELPKAIQFVYEAEKFSLYFSAQQTDNAEPMGGLKLYIDKKKIEMMKGIFKKLDRVHLTIVVRKWSRNLSDVDLSDIIQQFCFITDLYILDLTHEYTIWIGESCKTVQDFIDLEKFSKLRILKVKYMFVTDEFLEKVSNMKLESLMFIGCTFLTSKDTVQTVQQCKQIEVAFGESYETICFSKCKMYGIHQLWFALGLTYSIKIIINLNNCVKLRNLTVNMGEYASVILSKQIVSGLRYLSLGKNRFEPPLSSSKCQGARLEFLTIDTRDLELAVNVLKEINRNKLKNLVLICHVCDVSDLFNLEFAALEILEIDVSNNNLELKDKSTIEVKMKKLEALRINCKYVNEALVQMITELEMLKHLEIFVKKWNYNYELLCRQLSSLKGPIEKLLVSSEMTIGGLVRSIEPLNKLKEFYIDGRSIRSTFNSLANRNYGRFKSVKIRLNRLKELFMNSRFIRPLFYSLASRNYERLQPAKADANEQNVVHLKLHTLHIGMGSTYEELIELMLCQYFEAFAGIKKLVIDVVPKCPGVIQKLFGSMQEEGMQEEGMQEQFNNLIESVFETFNQLDVLVFCYKSSHISREEAHILRKLFSEKCKLVKERCEWSDNCNEERTIFELYK